MENMVKSKLSKKYYLRNQDFSSQIFDEYTPIRINDSSTYRQLMDFFSCSHPIYWQTVQIV